MLLGHLGVGLALKKVDNRVNLGILFFSVLFLDIILWIFVLLGIERVIIPDNYEQIHYLNFYFPYSHSLIATVIWASIVYLICRKKTSDNKLATAIFIGISSHFILDFIVHPAEIPLNVSSNSILIGLGAWNHMLFALFIELLLVIVGFVLYLKSNLLIRTRKKYGLITFMGLLCIFSFCGQLLSPRPGNSFQVAIMSISLLVLIIVIAYFIDRLPKAKF